MPTIAADWNPSLIFNCPHVLGGVGDSQLPKPNDGLVPVSSIESQGWFCFEIYLNGLMQFISSFC
jgi:hypothetical protein